jgi:hypothetical protein
MKDAEPQNVLAVMSVCVCCDMDIQIHIGQKSEFHDFMYGRLYSPTDLPQVEHGRLLVCLDCATDAKMVVKAGFTFVGEVFREARERAREEILASDDPEALEADESRFLAHYRRSLDLWPANELDLASGRRSRLRTRLMAVEPGVVE